MYYNYKSIALDIIKQIQSGELSPGDKIPTEKLMLEQYKVSKMTLRKAINLLNTLDITQSIERKGTFIKNKTVTQTTSTSFTIGYSLLARLKGMTNENKVVSFKVVLPTISIARILNIDESEEVYEIKRLRYLDNLPSAFEVSYLVRKEMPNLDKNELDKSLYNKVYEQHNLPIQNVSANIEAIIPDQYISSILELKPNEGVFLIEQVSKIHECNNLEYVLSYQAGSRINI